jgi:hypothetical protein
VGSGEVLAGNDHVEAPRVGDKVRYAEEGEKFGNLHDIETGVNDVTTAPYHLAEDVHDNAGGERNREWGEGDRAVMPFLEKLRKSANNPKTIEDVANGGHSLTIRWGESVGGFEICKVEEAWGWVVQGAQSEKGGVEAIFGLIDVDGSPKRKIATSNMSCEGSVRRGGGGIINGRVGLGVRWLPDARGPIKGDGRRSKRDVGRGSNPTREMENRIKRWRRIKLLRTAGGIRNIEAWSIEKDPAKAIIIPGGMTRDRRSKAWTWWICVEID